MLDDLATATTLHDQGVLPDEQFEAIETRLLAQLASEEERAAKENQAVAEKEERNERAAAAGAAKGQELRKRLGVSGSGFGMTVKSPIGPTARRERKTRRNEGPSSN